MLPLLHGSVVVCVVGAGCAGTRTYRDVLNEELKEAVDGAEHSLDRHVRQAAAVAATAGAGAGGASSSSGGGGSSSSGSITMTKQEVRFGKEGRESE